MEETAMQDQHYHDAAETVIRAGNIPFPVSDTLIDILKTIMTPEQARFVTLFHKPLNRDEIKVKSGLADAALDAMLDGLMDNGIVSGIPSRGSGMMVYRPMPPIPGIFETTMMKGEAGEKQKTLARLFERLFEELTGMVQENYDALAPAFAAIPPMTRIIPVETQIDRAFDTVLPTEDVKKLVERFDTIGVAVCYCRHQKDLLGRSCQVTDERKNCLFFGNTAKFFISRKFAEPISREQAIQILEKAEKDGLVHKAFHEKYDTGRDEMAICNCCKCCCETFQLFYRGGGPALTYTSYIATVDEDACIGCEACADICPMEAVRMDDGIARVDEARCIGCGVCAGQCDVEAITLKRTGQRQVCVMPPKRAA
jgi:Pyruvate/2-oxoacid:ferredoxin oxidoreductase delta subunit